MAWSQLPDALRTAVERHLGAPVVRADTQQGGFSPGVAARLTSATGERVFVKAVGPRPNAESAGIHRAEARIAAALPPDVQAPRLLAEFDRDGWVVLVFEDVEGAMPAQPWVPDELDRVLAAVADLARTLTPAPDGVAPALGVRAADTFQGWRRLAAAARHRDDHLDGLDPWARRHLYDLAALESGWETAAEGTTLNHGDLRADNLLLTADRVMVVDWPWASVGAVWFDLLAMLPSVRMQGGPPPETVFDRHPVAEGADPAAVTAVLAAVSGYFVGQSRLPDPPGLPTVRAFQAAQGRAALAWLRARTGWH
ncbi:phosphotransferase family protein [Actinacidiphila acidipaludis]|uniref:Aminoglycoside phosphotransferase family protein n=1 Tax=Actinacidiphila acidipaludis TaxID=2873382 RepID=A0ABS7QI73_9ACTN|nr:aminoglycoside phosphotransferase family protein [Streptomyces acidipaludis]